MKKMKLGGIVDRPDLHKHAKSLKWTASSIQKGVAIISQYKNRKPKITHVVVPALKHKGKRREVKAYGVLLPDENGELLPVALTFKTRSLLMENIPMGKKGEVVPVKITYYV